MGMARRRRYNPEELHDKHLEVHSDLRMWTRRTAGRRLKVYRALILEFESQSGAVQQRELCAAHLQFP